MAVRQMMPVESKMFTARATLEEIHTATNLFELSQLPVFNRNLIPQETVALMRASGSVGPSGQTTHQPQPIYGARPTPKQATSQSCFKCNAALDRKHPWPAAECRRGQSEAKAGADVKKVSVLPQTVPKAMPGAVPSAPCSRCGGDTQVDCSYVLQAHFICSSTVSYSDYCSSAVSCIDWKAAAGKAY